MESQQIMEFLLKMEAKLDADRKTDKEDLMAKLDAVRKADQEKLRPTEKWTKKKKLKPAIKNCCPKWKPIGRPPR
jgi:hypothetical protein